MLLTSEDARRSDQVRGFGTSLADLSGLASTVSGGHPGDAVPLNDGAPPRAAPALLPTWMPITHAPADAAFPWDDIEEGWDAEPGPPKPEPTPLAPSRTAPALLPWLPDRMRFTHAPADATVSWDDIERGWDAEPGPAKPEPTLRGHVPDAA